MGVRFVNPGLLFRVFFIYFVLSLCDSFLLFLASLGRFVLSVQGFLFRFTNVFRVYRAAPCLHRGPARPHYGHLAATLLNWRRFRQHRRWAAPLGLLTTLIFVVLSLHSRNSEAQQGGYKCDRQGSTAGRL
jgi:hypothetical protein